MTVSNSGNGRSVERPGGVGDELLHSVPERRTVRVPVHDRGDHLGETQTRLGDGGINRGIGLGGTELLIVGE